MVEIKEFIGVFFKTEAELATRKRVPDLEAYNDSVESYNDLVIGQLNAARLEELQSARVYKIHEGSDPDQVRHLFKISQYSHVKYGDVWVCYASSQDPDEDHKILNEAVIIVKEGAELKVATKYGYSRQDTSEKSYKWEIEAGYRDLTFDSLGSPVAIERYQEPVESFDGLKHYKADI